MSAALNRRLGKWLVAHGCRFERQGKGAHEIWYSPRTQRRFVMVRTLKSHHTATAILARAGVERPAWLGGRG
ncbi:MAG: type II toxin-antitoxin system HicA family toxin [Acidobacteriota bacterium]